MTPTPAARPFSTLQTRNLHPRNCTLPAEPSAPENHTARHDGDSDSSSGDAAAAASDDFAAALENFETETEEAVGEDHVIKGRVVKLTATHVVVDIGAKSEGMVPIAEGLDHEGKPKFQPGDEIDVMREKSEQKGATSTSRT